MLEISFEENSTFPPIGEDFLRFLYTFLETMLEEFESQDRYCSLLICDDSFTKELNKQYRQKDSATDVLSFAMDDDEEFNLENSALGDIIISAETALRQSQEFEISYEEELARLSIHGMLHLMGYDHEISEEDHKEMFEIQDNYMEKFMLDYNNSRSSLI